MPGERDWPVLASALIAVALLAQAALLAAHVVNRLTLEHRMVDLGQESNLPTWLSSSQFLLAALLTGLAAAVARRRAARLGWAWIAALALAMSVDEAAALHEEAGTRLGATVTLSLTQPVAAVLVAATLLVVAASAAPRPATALRVAAALIVTSQVCASVAGLFLDGTALFGLETLEDVTETLTGTALLVAALEATGVRVEWRPGVVRSVDGRRPG